MNNESQTCKTCVMDTSDEGIHFNENGICNHCEAFAKRSKRKTESKEAAFQKLISEIKASNPKGKYHCLAAVSGGTDSSYMMHKLKQEGLNVLAVHVDAGWNAPEANINLQSIVENIGVDYFHYKIDWPAFRALQLSYIRAGVVDLELPTDHVLFGALYDAAQKHNIKYILTGQNSATEFFMPKAWVFDKNDAINLMDIYHQFGDKTSLKNLPLLTSWNKFKYYNLKKIKLVFLLEHLDYNKQNAEQELATAYGWKPYKTKHGESIWTRFYQCHILPTRFGIDKRKAHYSNLIASKQMTKAQAQEWMKGPLYTNDLEADKQFILKRFEIEEAEFDKYLTGPIRKHEDFKTEKKAKAIYHKLKQILNPIFKLRTSPTY